MVRINDKTLEDFIVSSQDVLQNSLVTVSHSFQYNVGQTNYTLPGFATGNERIYSIESIEGTGYLPEDYITEDDLTEGVEYSLWDDYSSPEFVDSGYGTSSGDQVYSGVTIVDQTFKDKSTVHVKYKFQNPNYVPILTNFSPNSVLRMILTAILINNQQTNLQLSNSIKTFGIEATGEDLDRIATLVGLTRTSATFTSGQVLATNTDSTDYTVTTAHRFGSIAGGGFITFKPVNTTIVPANGTAYIDVEATEAGSSFNVGANSITYVFTTNNLTTQAPNTISVINPPVGNVGQENLFNNGADEETDAAFRNRIISAFSQTKTSSYNTIEKAVEDTSLIKTVRVYDIDLKKDLNENEIFVAVATQDGNILSDTSLSQILDESNVVKPAGSILTVRQIMNTYIGFDFTIYVSVSTLSNTAQLEADLTEQVDEFIKSKEIGEDVLPTSVVSILRGNTEVIDLIVNNNTVSEYVSEVGSLNSTISLATGGTADNYIAIEVPFNSATNFVNDLDSTLAGTYDLSANGDPYPVDRRTAPRVNIGVEGYDGLIRPSARNRRDYYLGGARDTITYDPDPDATGTDEIKDTDTVLFNYNYFDNTTIDGFRIRLGGDSGNVVSIDFGYGSDGSPDNTSANWNSLATATATLDGTERLYEFEFSTQIDTNNDPTYSPEATTFWIILSHSSGSGDSYLPIDNTGTTVPFNPALLTDAEADAQVFETTTSDRAIWQSYTKNVSNTAYEKIIIPSETDQPENPVPYNYTFTFAKYIEG